MSEVCTTSSPTASAHRFCLWLCDSHTFYSFVISWRGETKVFSHVTSKTRWRNEQFRFVTWFFLRRPRGIYRCRRSISWDLTLIAQTFYTLVTVVPQNWRYCHIFIVSAALIVSCAMLNSNATILSSTPGILHACMWIFVFFHAIQRVCIEQGRC